MTGKVSQTSPPAAVQFQSKTDGSRVVAVRDEANPSSDNRRINRLQLGDIRVAVSVENLQRVSYVDLIQMHVTKPFMRE